MSEMVAGKIKRRTHACASIMVGVLALVVLVAVNWLIGLGLLIVAACMEGAEYTCGACGNRVEKTSRLCPVCRVGLRTYESGAVALAQGLLVVLGVGAVLAGITFWMTKEAPVHSKVKAVPREAEKPSRKTKLADEPAAVPSPAPAPPAPPPAAVAADDYETIVAADGRSIRAAVLQIEPWGIRVKRETDGHEVDIAFELLATEQAMELRQRQALR